MKKLFIFCLLPVLMFIFSGAFTTVKAGPGQPPVLQVLDGSLGQLSKDSFNIVSDTLFFDASYNSVLTKPYLVRNTLTFHINAYSPYFLKKSFTATIRLEVTTTDVNNTTHVFDTSLTVRYNKDSLITDRDSYLFSNAYRVQVKVLSTQTDADWNVWQSLQLENELQSFPVFTFDCTKDTILTLSHTALDSTTTLDELPVNWSNVVGADEYDLEWTYIDSSALKGPNQLYGNPASPSSALIFDNSSSRVTITGTTYNIPIFYDGAGTLFFRVRPVQLQAGGGRTEGHWSSDNQSPAGFYFKGHQRNLNWQSTASYAEEGKRKVVLQYYDGSLRGRQTVTKDNTTNTTIVSESYYDYQGRPVIQVLPAPTFNNVIGYSKNFNLGLNGAYDKNDFDSIANPSLYCNSGANAMRTDSGAAQYYSSSNRDKDTGIAKFIPDAQGYPFTEVQYVQDNTGRIAKQSGVGYQHRLGGGHETVYYYGTPGQQDLDALFGTEVGDASHYFKTMVQDANGQLSISYTDMHGRTIATALAGLPSARLDTLSSYKAQFITEPLSTPTSNTISDLTMESKKGLLVEVPDSFYFSYKLDPASLQLSDCNSKPVCYDCLYDLEITITDDCNNQKLGGAPIDKLFHNFSLTQNLDTTCGKAADTFGVKFTQYLPIGSYEITKRLTVSRYGENYYRDSVFMKRNTCQTINSILQTQKNILDSTVQCTPSCQSCKDSLGDWPTYYNRFIARAGISVSDSSSYTSMALTAYQSALAACRLLCDSVSTLDDIKQAMLLDMTAPSGQYANLDSASDSYSIFYLVPVGKDTVPRYTLITNYVDENGNPDLVYDENTGEMVPPQQLSPIAFVQKFKLSWAQALLMDHPEYNKLMAYEGWSLSADWDKRFGAVDDYADALKDGYLNPTDNSNAPFSSFAATGPSPDYDPLAVHYTGFKTNLEDSLQSYIVQGGILSTKMNLWAFATASIACAGKGSGCFLDYQEATGLFPRPAVVAPFNSSMCTGDLDMAWRTFRQMYLDIKQKLINAQLQAYTPTASTLLAAYHQPHFTDAAELAKITGIIPTATDSATAVQQNQTIINNYYAATCLSYANMWWQNLQPCNLHSVDSAIIIPQLIQVCEQGSDANHPYGASSVSLASTYRFKSFEEVIDHYIDSIGGRNSNCNAYLIKAPAPYDQQVIYSAKPLWTSPDSCECSQIWSMHNNYLAVASHYLSFSDYLYKNFQASVPDSSLTKLLSLCSMDPSTASCNYLATPIMLPPALQCSSGDVCVGCTRFKLLDSMFRAKYPGIVPVTDPSSSDSVQLSENQLYENFMNYHLGFSKTTVDYLNFLITCNGGGSGGSGGSGSGSSISYDTASISCAGLDSLIAEYKRSYLQPVTGYADLDMRTFTGNITPAEGPKGVFNVHGLLIGNTTDTAGQVNASYARIWNSDTANHAIGTLSPLSNGKFHLALNPGQLIPKNGIIGERYYQFVCPYDTLDAVLTNRGSYVDFGDGQHFKVDSAFVSAQTKAGIIYSAASYYIYSFYWVSHVYPTAQNRTITVYHTDTLGILGFDNYLLSNHAYYLPGLKNLTGYAPQDFRIMHFHSTQDSTMNTWDGFKNKASLSGLSVALLGSGDGGVTYFKNSRFGSFTRFNQLKFINLESVDSTVTMRAMFPNMPVNFPLLQAFALLGATPLYDTSINLSLSHLGWAVIFNIDTSINVDHLVNELAASTTVYGGAINNTPGKRTAASDSALAKLTARNWSIEVADYDYNINGWTISPPRDTTAVLTNAYPVRSQFSDFINGKFGTVMYPGQLDSLFLRKCGKLPDYTTPDTTTTHSGSPPADSCADYSFVNTYPGARDAMDVVQTSDGGWLVAGLAGSSSSRVGFVMKTDKKGTQQWMKYYGSTGMDTLIKIRATSDGGFVVVGNTSVVKSGQGLVRPFVVKADASGNVQWAKAVITVSEYGDRAADIIQLSDGEYALAATYNFLPNYADFEVVKLDASGNVAWASQFIGHQPGDHDDYIHGSDDAGGLVEDGDYIIFSGLLESGDYNENPDSATYYDGGIMKINKSTGDYSGASGGWFRAYDMDHRSNWFSDIYNTSTGYLIRSIETNDYGSKDDEHTIFKVDKSGNTVWAKKLLLPLADSSVGSTSVYPTADGGYISMQNDSASKTLYIQKIDGNGDLIWTNQLLLPGTHEVSKIIQNADGSYTAVGYNANNILMLHFTSSGKTGCFDSTVTLSDVGAIVNTRTVSIGRTNLADYITTSSISVNAGTASYSQSTLCSSDYCHVVKDTVFLCGRSAPVFAPVNVNTITNCSDSNFFAVSKSSALYNFYSDSLQGNFDSRYRAKCMDAYKYESFTVTHTVSEYHHTLYYYDQAGNLLKTVPPAGVQEDYDSVWLLSVAAARAAGLSLVPSHGLKTQYRYNTLNQVVTQQTPDGGQSSFWYDRLGRLVISQNARQKNASTTELGRQYSYTLYDSIGRITEVGQITNAGSAAMTDSISRVEGNLTAWINNSASNKEQITQTVYDAAYPGFPGISYNPLVQRNLRNRVSYTSFTLGSNHAQYNQGTFYTYDIEGNVDTLLQDYGSSSFSPVQNVMNMNGNRFKRMVYQYDLVSGKVNSVAYQPHQVDAFYHRYTYDAENRLILAETSQDSVFWDKDARYEYYKHGPLARAIIGDKMVQGLDYAYTLQRWLKGVNSSSLLPGYDMGRDGDTSSQNRYVARDAYGFGLNYYTGDYYPITTSGAMPFPGSSAYLDSCARPLFNGNISSMAVNLSPLYRNVGGANDTSHWRGPLLYNYHYDQLNRITGLDAYYGLDQTANSWAGLMPTADFKERASYDGNGNIQKYLRNNFGETGLPMDSLGYKYKTGTNQLCWIKDSASNAIGGGYDLHNQTDSNYRYDSIGNLIKDRSEHIGAIKWNVYGKITEIDHDSTWKARPTKNIYYYYDAAGNRVGKKVTRGDSVGVSYTWYVRDASGNVMAIYTTNLDSSQALSAADVHIGEKDIYGSSRLGLVNTDYSTDANTDGLSIYTSPWIGAHLPYYTGQKQYELANHLGNVLATISDKKIGVSLATDSSLIDHYEADVQTAQDYYPFGMVMPGRMFAKLNIPGGSVDGTTQVNGYPLPVDLELSSRQIGGPSQYVASSVIDLTDGFTSEDNADITAYIADTSYAGTGNGGSDGGNVAGAGKYRYSFGGQEKDDEIKGANNSYTAAFWEYDPRIGRRWNLDPKPVVGISQYSTFNNRPTWIVDPLGDSTGDPIMPRHPVEKFSDAQYLLYNAIGSVVNGVQSLVSKAGDYGGALTSGAPLQAVSDQIGNDFDALKGGAKSSINYYRNTPNSQIASDAKDFLTKPDNYFNALENTAGILASGKLVLPAAGTFSELVSAEKFTLKTASVTAKPAMNTLVSLSEETFSQALYKGAEKIGDYVIYGTKGMVGNTFNRNIFLIETSNKGLAGFRAVIGNMEAEAIKAGANKISIYGSSVINKGFLNPTIATRFGYTFEQSGTGVILQKTLKH